MSTKKIQIINSSYVTYNEQTLTDDQKIQARANIGAGVPQVQTDYAQNDSTAPDYVKNRLAWSEGRLETLINTTLQVIDRTDFYTADLGELSLIEGEEYIVSFEYDEYNCLCRMEMFERDNSLVLGNANIYDSNKPDTGEPFLIEIFERNGKTFGELYTYSGYIINISISKPAETVHQLDEKYIPDTIARKSDIPTELPSVTTSDSGKFLRVSADGTWVAETIPHIEEVAF